MLGRVDQAGLSDGSAAVRTMRRDLHNRQVGEFLMEKSVEAVATLSMLLDSPDERIRLAAIDRTGFAPGAERRGGRK